MEAVASVKANDNTPIYNVKAVVRETGIKPDTLRAWERRYGLPIPNRTASGHRLYSPRDVETVKWLIARQNEGLSIGRAVDLWERLSENNEDPLATPGHRHPDAPRAATRRDPQPTTFIHGADRVVGLRAAWVNACLHFEEAQAEAVLSEAFSLLPTEQVCTQIIQAGLAEIGKGWHDGRVTIQQEHFASALAIRRLETMLAATPIPSRRERILIGCPPQEEHVFPPLMLSLLLRRHGFDVIYLGANVPLRSLEKTLQETKPKLVILTAQQLSTAADLQKMAEVLADNRIPLAYGGSVFATRPALVTKIPGHYLGNQLDTALDKIESLAVRPHLQPALQETPLRYLATRDRFARKQAEIESEIWQRYGGNEMEQGQLAQANAHVGRAIQAALSFGDMNVLGPDIRWIQDLLATHYQMSPSMLMAYLHAYHDAVNTILGSDGEIIRQWLAQLLDITENSDVQGETEKDISHSEVSQFKSER